MTSTVITSTTIAGKPKQNSRFKSCINEHCYIVDFLSASIIICLCLIILLPRVHDSFLPSDDGAHIDHDNQIQQQQQEKLDENVTNHNQPLGVQSIVNGTNQPDLINLPDQQTVDQIDASIEDSQPDNGHHHHHEHFPAGELLICIGFFVFYCTGLGLARPQVNPNEEETNLARSLKRTTSTVCCSSTRCPPSVHQAAVARGLDTNVGQEVADRERMEMFNELAVLSPADESLVQQQQLDTDCVMLLNRHHQHHTHASHRGHQVAVPQTGNIVKNKRQNYGSTQSNSYIKQNHVKADTTDTYNGQAEATDISHVSPDRNATIIVDEIRITSGPVDEDKVGWPHSLRMLIFSLILAFILIFFEINVQGMIRAVKVFRATSTGALLYVAFFIMLPRRPAGCNSCKEEET